jgi:hypothetical protein
MMEKEAIAETADTKIHLNTADQPERLHCIQTLRKLHFRFKIILTSDSSSLNCSLLFIPCNKNVK